MDFQNLISSVNPRAKRLSLRVDSRAGVIRLTIPKWTMQRSIDRFLNDNQTWIHEKSALLHPKINIKNGEIIPFLGIDRIIKIDHHTKRTTEISITDNHITIRTSRADPTSNLKRWMIDECRKVIEPMAYDKASTIKKSISKIDLRDTSSRWGSCSTDKRLMFSWRLIMAPKPVLDYVVAHEVAHLKHMDHSKKFWDMCYDLTDDDADNSRKWLQDNGNALMRWF